MGSNAIHDRLTHQNLGLLLGTEAPVMTPNGVDFSFFLLFLSGLE